MTQNLEFFKETKQDNPEYHKNIHETFSTLTNEVPELKELRDWVEVNIFGFGERSFYHMWKLIVDEMPREFSFLEIGVFRGQTMALIQILANLAGKNASIYGVTPLDSTDGHWESDYRADIFKIHEDFNLPQPIIIEGLSTELSVISKASSLRPFDLVYIDGGHSYDVVKNDLEAYPPMVKPGGYLIVDDCSNKFNIPFGMFPGIEPVSRAVDEMLPPFTENEKWEYFFNVVHNRIWRNEGTI